MDAALEAGDARPSPDVVDVVDAPDAQDVGVACDGGAMACSGRCVSTQTDTMNCGACGNACPTSAGSVASCVMGMCRATCVAGYEMVGSACEMIAPRPVFPPGTSTVTNLRPTLKWALPMGVDGAEVELCRDRACTMMIERVTATGATARPMADLPRSSVVFWRVRGRVGAATGTRTSPTWQFRTRATSTTVDTAYGTELDVNGDGFTDLAVGAPGANAGAGAVRFYYGGPTGPSLTVGREMVGPSAATKFGQLVTAAGDTDGDGFGDVIVAAPLAAVGGRTNAGQVYVLRGSASGVVVAASATVEGVSSRDQFGISASGAGDINGDGYGDILVGAPQVNMAGLSGVGEVAVFYGSASGIGGGAPDRLPGAYLVAGASDFDGDGFSDALVGHVETASGGRPFAGAAYVLHGRATGLDPTPRRVLLGQVADAGFGWVTSIGDVDGDGYGDAAIGSPQADPMGVTNGGVLAMYSGSSTGIGAMPFFEVVGDADAGLVGLSVQSLRDFGGRDLVVVGVGTASPRGLSRAGEVRVYSVSSARTVMTIQTLEGSSVEQRFGTTLGAGNFDNDAFTDLAVASPGLTVGGVSAAGATWVYGGSASGVRSTSSRVYSGREMGERVGAALGGGW